jgi:hypothetical protein
VLAAALAHALEQRRGEPARDLGMADERGRLVVRRRDGDRLDPVLAREVVELVRRTPGIDQVREDHRVLRRLHRQPRQRLEIVSDKLRFADLV